MNRESGDGYRDSVFKSTDIPERDTVIPEQETEIPESETVAL